MSANINPIPAVDADAAAASQPLPHSSNNVDPDWDAFRLAGEAAKEAFKAQRMLEIAMKKMAAQLRENQAKQPQHKGGHHAGRSRKRSRSASREQEVKKASNASSETDISFHIDLTSSDADRALQKVIERTSVSRHHHHNRDRSRSRSGSRGRSRGRSRGHSRGHSRGRSRGNSRGRSRGNSRGRSHASKRHNTIAVFQGKHYSRSHSRSLSKDSRGHIRHRSHLSRDRSRSASKGRMCGEPISCLIESRPIVCHLQRGHSYAGC